MRKIGSLAVIVVCGILIVGGTFYLSRMQKKTANNSNTLSNKEEQADFLRTEQLIQQGKVNEALKIIHQHEGLINTRTKNGRQWLNLLIESAVKTSDFGQLILLYEAYPRSFENNERASIMTADGYIIAKRPQEYKEIREKWHDKATLREMWFMLDVDALLLQGQNHEALRLLKSTKFEGKKDVDRLVRLALLYVIDDPKTAWDYLSEAYSLDPQNPDIITYRGNLLESLGKTPLALYEYLAAIQADPGNLLLRDQLAEFYMRRNNTSQALAVWLETLSKPSLDVIWLKALFWSKVITPVNFDWAKAPPPVGGDKPFIEYLMALPPGTFWDDKAFEKLPDAKKYLSNLQITFWLRLLECLKKGDDKQIYNLLKFNPFFKSLVNPQLEKALKQIVSYRTNKTLNFDTPLFNQGAAENKSDEVSKEEKSDNEPERKDSLFKELDEYAYQELIEGVRPQLPHSLHALIVSDEAFAAAFLSAGWLEAALQLHKMNVLPDDFPDWVATGLTQALWQNRSPAQAIDFALKQKKTPSLLLMIGDLYIANNKLDNAIEVLQPLLKEAGYMGDRAAWLSSVAYADKQDYTKAKELIESHAALANTLQGKEALARIALHQGDEELANKLYAQLEDQSPEAMSYLARKAFAEKNWKRARELTEQLLLKFPDSPILRDNLNKIIEEQNAQKRE